MKRHTDDIEEKDKKRRKRSEPTKHNLKYTSQEEPNFSQLHAENFPTLVLVPRSVFPKDFHSQMYNAFQELLTQGLFQSFSIQPQQKRFTKTSVLRSFLGPAGMTYKYFDIRVFAYPWDLPSGPAPLARLSMKSLRDSLKSQAEQKISEGNFKPQSSDWNFGFLNYFDPKIAGFYSWKEDPYHNMGRLAIGWHQEPKLDEPCSVGVYQYTVSEEAKTGDLSEDIKKSDRFYYDSGWKLGYRRMWDSETPALMVSYNSGDSYLMLHDFNDKNQHAVVAGSDPRFSVTFRKTVFDNNTLEYITERGKEGCLARDRIKEIKSASEFSENFWKDLVFLQEVKSELELDWIRPFWLHGSHHAELHTFWKQHVENLEATWHQLETEMKRIFEIMQSTYPEVPSNSVNNLNDLRAKIAATSKSRIEWHSRYWYFSKNREEGETPIQKPEFTEATLPENLKTILKTIDGWFQSK